MVSSRRSSAWSWMLGLYLLLASLSRAHADPYYNATDVSTLTRAQYAALYPTSPGVSLTAAQVADLPGIHGYQGATYRVPAYFPMMPTYYNGAGTVLGIVPSGQTFGDPYSTPTIGYAQMHPDGTFGPFAGLSSMQTAEAFLNSQNQILLSGSSVDAKIIDLNKGITTAFDSIVSPATFQKYGAWLFPYGIADNGTILADYYNSSTNTRGDILLSPPDVPLPVPAPEPSALCTLLFGLGVLALRRRLRSKG